MYRLSACSSPQLLSLGSAQIPWTCRAKGGISEHIIATEGTYTDKAADRFFFKVIMSGWQSYPLLAIFLMTCTTMPSTRTAAPALTYQGEFASGRAGCDGATICASDKDNISVKQWPNA